MNSFEEHKNDEKNGLTEQTIGQRLKRAREEKGISLREVEEQTKIRYKYLEAMEEEDFPSLPGESYTKIFLSSYGQYLGIDEKALIRDYKNMFQKDTSEEVLPLQQENGQEKDKKAQLPSVNKRPSLPKPSFGNKKKFLLIGIVIFVIIVTAIWLLQRDKAIHPYGEAQLPPPGESQEQHPPTTGNTNPEKVEEPAFRGAELKVKFIEDCWVEVHEDERVVFTGTVKAGEEKTWKGVSYVYIKFGNAGAAQVTFNGKDLGIVGKSGAVEEKTYKAHG